MSERKPWLERLGLAGSVTQHEADLELEQHWRRRLDRWCRYRSQAERLRAWADALVGRCEAHVERYRRMWRRAHERAYGPGAVKGYATAVLLKPGGEEWRRMSVETTDGQPSTHIIIPTCVVSPVLARIYLEASGVEVADEPEPAFKEPELIATLSHGRGASALGGPTEFVYQLNREPPAPPEVLPAKTIVAPPATIKEET